MGRKSNISIIIASVLVFGGFFGMTIYIAQWVVPEENRDMFREMQTTMRDSFLIAISFYFGSSYGSRKLQDKLNEP